MVERICTYTQYLAGHPKRYAEYLYGDLSGHIKLISIAKSVLDVAELATQQDKYKSSKIHEANTLLGDVKAAIYLIKTPAEIPCLLNRYRKTKNSYSKLYDHWRVKGEVDNRKALHAATLTCGSVNKTLSMLGDGVFKPLKMADRYADIGGGVRDFADSWQYLSVAKSGSKISYIIGRLLLGSKKPFYKLIELIIEIWDTILNILKLTDVKVHPAVSVTFSVTKSAYSLYEVYMKTA